MNEREFKIGEKSFQLNKIDVFKQFNIARRLLPIFRELIPAAGNLSKLEKSELDNPDLDKLSEMLGPVLEYVSKMSEEDSTGILLGLLECVEVKQSFGNFAFLVRDKKLMFQDLEMTEMLQCAGRALMYNMAGFFSSMPQISKEGKLKPKGK